jgi:hypothetical protein
MRNPPAPAGYSGTPLVKKLGIKEDSHVALLNAPRDLRATLGSLPAGVHLADELDGAGPFDVVVFFTMSREELAAAFGRIARRLVPNGGFWVAWPKRASKLATNMTENVAREVGLEAGLVDNKVCAIDATWSGLRFVFRLADRPKKRKTR